MSTEKKTLTLKTADGQEFVVEESVAIQCATIKNLVEDDCASSVIPLPNISKGTTMAKIIEYLKKHADETVSDDNMNKFDDQFFNMVLPELFELILAANYLNHQDIIDKCALQIADSIKNKSPEKIREIFNIENDFPPREEADIRNRNLWAFEGVVDAD